MEMFDNRNVANWMKHLSLICKCFTT